MLTRFLIHVAALLFVFYFIWQVHQSILGAAHDNWQTIRRLDGLIDDVTALHPNLLASIRAGLSAFRSAQREQFAAHKAAFAAWRSKWPAVRELEFAA